MAKSTKALSGAAKNAYLKRVVRSEAEISSEARERLTDRLVGEIASVTLRPAVAPGDEADRLVTATEDGAARAASAATLAVSDRASTAFDPYSPNVVVVIRTRGRDATLAQLGAIKDVDNLRLLAREQQLGIPAGLASAEKIRQAIVDAAERRIANRRAAAS
jgi:hypothetical protein